MPLCYLWRRDQKELLEEMINTGLCAVVVKVAGLGLLQRHLGRTLEELRDYLHELVLSAFVIYYKVSCF